MLALETRALLQVGQRLAAPAQLHAMVQPHAGTVLGCGGPRHVSTCHASRTHQHTALVLLAPSLLCWPLLTDCVSPEQSRWGKIKDECEGSS